MSELEKRKRMLVAESEVYRELLKLELQNFRIYGMRARKRATSPGAWLPLLLTAAPAIRTLFTRRGRSSLKQWLGLALMGWQLYRRYGSILRRRSYSEVEKSAAEEYLAKRI